MVCSKLNHIMGQFEQILEKGKEENKNGNYKKAVECYSECINIKEDTDVYFYRGYIYNTFLQMPNEALIDFNKAIELKEDSPEVFLNRGILYWYHFKKLHEAYEDFNSALKLKPDYAMAYFNRGRVNYDLMEYGKAINDWEKACELEPRFEDSIRLLIDKLKS